MIAMAAGQIFHRENPEILWMLFEITAGNDIINGTILPLSLHIQSDDGYDRIEILSVQIGEVSVIDPLGSG